MLTAEKVISEKDLKKLITKLENQKNKALKEVIAKSDKVQPGEIRTIMDYFLFSIISMTGLRVSEAIRLEMVDIGPDYIIIPHSKSKNKKKGTVYYGDKTREIIYDLFEFHTEYLKGRYHNEDYLFPSHSKAGHITRSYAHKRFKYWLAVAGLSTHHSVHHLRHSFSTICLDKGLPLTFVRDQLRHSSISITSQYLHLTKENRDRVKDIF